MRSQPEGNWQMTAIRRAVAAIILSIVLALALGPASADDVCLQVGVGEGAPAVCVPFP